jgi:sugar diacid utilization regulator
VLVSPGGTAERHLALAGSLRTRRLLAVSEGRRVAGLAHRAITHEEVGLEPSAVIAQGATARRAELPEAFDELRVAADVALRRGRAGAVEPDDYLAELLLRRSPRLGARLRARVHDRLAEHDPELTRTLEVLVEHDFDRGATAAALPVHRNTLTNRLARIRAITGLDVDGAEGRALLWLASLERAAAPR